MFLLFNFAPRSPICVEAADVSESPINLPLSVGQAPLTCSAAKSNNGKGNGNIGKLAVCDAGCGSNNGSCACPAGYYEVSGGLVDTLGLDGQCCPIGTKFEDDSVLGLGSSALCTGLNLKKAVSVPDINNPEQNALESFTPPFQINLPAAGGRTEGDDWYPTPPTGEGNN